MTSNILAGERRWASARRTGMTVLGKVAVPKPLNLPSQKLENHGMDPNVEIVPKGSIGWGSRHSSSASNPWGSSSISSTAEGYGSSPGHPSGRPSSSGSRPSTAGSEITHDHGGNAWGLSSRPSSASGISASNQTSLTSSRPHSADTRPASSQISRFAEQHADSVAAHHPVVSSERGGLASSSDKERFSLSSGDFPTLNAVADSSLKSSGSSGSRDQGSHSRPTSAFSEVAKKENSDISQPDIDNATVNAWRREGHRNSDEMHPSMDKWHGEPPHYHNPNVPPPQFDGWRGPSMNHPGVWYQGLPPGPPYGPPVGPGGFPVEPPYSFYCPRVPPSGLPNSQPVPLTRPGPMGHPKNGEIYRPPMPDAFVRPGMPFRPGFYHGPPMPFEGYYGPPPMGYCNPNEHEVPFNAMPHGPPAYNRYPARDNDPAFNDSTATHNRTGKNSSGIRRFSEKAEPNHFHDVPEHHVILKHNDDVNQGGQWGENVAKQNYPNPNKRSQPGVASRTKEWGADDCDNEDDMYSRSPPHDLHSSSGPSDACGGSDSITIRSGPYGSGDNVAMDNIQSKKLETAASPLAGDGILPSSAIPRGPTLIQKIDGLNEKVRTSDFRNEGPHPSQWAEQKGRNEGPHPSQWAEQKGRNEGPHPSQWAEQKGRNEGPHPSQWAEQKGRNEGPHPSQWAEQKGRNEGPHPSQWAGQKGRNEGSHPSQWAEQKDRNEGLHPSQWSEQKSRNEGSHPSKWAEQKGTGAVIGEIIVPLGDRTSHVTTAAPRRGYGVVRGKTGDYNKQKFNGPGDADGWQKQPAASVQSQNLSSASDIHENRTNTTIVAAEVLPEKREVDNEVVDGTDSQRLKMREMVKQRALQLQKEEEERTREQKAKALAKLEELNRRNTMIQMDEKVGPEGHYESSKTGEWGAEEEPADSDNYLPFETPKTALLDTPHVLPNPSLPSKEESVIDGDRDSVVPPQLNEATNKQPGYKQKQSGSRKNLVTKARNNNTELADSEIGNVAPGDVGSGSDSKTSDIIHVAVESSSSQQRRRSSNRNTKNKHNKYDDLPPASTFPSTAVDESKPPLAVSVQIDTNGDGAQGSVNHHQKPQKSGRFARNQPTGRFSDKYHGNDHVVWAPVQPQNKTEPATETGQKAVEESAISAKNDDQMQNNMKSKRAEMERYVPKPVAKELAQQSTVQQSDEVAEKVEPESKSSVAENVARVADSRVEDSKHNKQTKAVGGWRQRGPSSFKPNPRNQQSVEPELSNTETEEQQSGFKDPNASDDVKKIQNDSDAGIVSHQAQGGRYQENTGRAKRHALKGERGMRNDREHGSQKPDKSHIQQQDPKMNPAVKSSSTKENRGSEDRPSSSHWQPKSSSISNISGGDSSTTAQHVAGGSVKKGIQSLPEEQHIREVDSSQADPSLPKGNFSIEGTVSQQGQRREKKVPYSSKGSSQSHAPNEDESAFGGSDESQTKQQQFSSDNWRGGRYQNARSFMNREVRGDINHERQGQNIQHYEYQPIPGRNEKNTEDGSHNVGLRYKERGQHSRRGRGGQFHGRQSSSNVQVGAGYG